MRPMPEITTRKKDDDLGDASARHPGDRPVTLPERDGETLERESVPADLGHRDATS